MKILFLTSGSVHSNFTYRALSLARELQKLGHETALVCPKADKYNGFVAEDVKELDGVRVIQPRQFVTKRMEVNLLPYIFGALKTVITEKPDLIYIYKPTPISIVGLAGKFLRHTPVVLDMDDLGAEVMKLEGFPRFQWELVGWCETAAARYCDRIVVASTYLKERYAEQYPGKPLYLMPNGVDASWLSPVEPSRETKRIVFMGTLGRKEILEGLFDVLPDVIARYPDTKLMIIGSGPYEEYFKSKAISLGIEKNVIFMGWLRLKEARANLRAGDIGYCFMPDEISTRAASNMKISQYMVRGVVPMVSKTGDLPLMTDGGRAGYIIPSEEISDIKAEVLRSLNDPMRMTAKAEAARTFAIKNLTWRKLAAGFSRWIGAQATTEGQDKDKIFLVASSVPGDFGGSEIRNLNLARQLVKSGKKVHIFCIINEGEDARVRSLAREAGVTVTAIPKAKGSFFSRISPVLHRMQPFMEEYRRSGLGQAVFSAASKELPSVIQLEQIEAYYMLLEYIPQLRQGGAKIVLDAHNVEAEAFRGAIEFFPEAKRFIGKCLLGRLRDLEISAAQHSDAVLACSDKDANYFRNHNDSVFVVANGVDTTQFHPVREKQARNLIFIGGTKYAPNADALRFYLQSIHPLVKKSFPDVQLLAIGATEDFLRKNGLRDGSVSALGFVDDIVPYLERATIGICPIRQGSGTRLKVLTFMAAGLPVVATSKGAEGIDYSDGKDIMIADSADKFADSITRILDKGQFAETIGCEARVLMEQKYDWNIIGEKLAAVYETITVSKSNI